MSEQATNSGRSRGPAARRAAPSSKQGARAPAQEPPAITLGSPERLINRELSWLSFNTRVMEESLNARNPLLERLRFVAISASNLDEFYMVRVAGLKGMVNADITSASDDGLSPGQQLAEITREVATLMSDQQTDRKSVV